MYVEREKKKTKKVNIKRRRGKGKGGKEQAGKCEDSEEGEKRFFVNISKNSPFKPLKCLSK